MFALNQSAFSATDHRTIIVILNKLELIVSHGTLYGIIMHMIGHKVLNNYQ